MATTKQKTEPAPNYTPEGEYEFCKRRVTDGLTRYLQSFNDLVDKFQKSAAVNPVDAMEWDGQPAMIGWAVRELCDRTGLTEMLPSLPVVSEKDMKTLKWQANHQVDEVIRYGDYRPNSTSPISNINNQCRFRAKQIVAQLLRWLVWELEYLEKCRLLVESGAKETEPDHNPYTLI